MASTTAISNCAVARPTRRRVTTSTAARRQSSAFRVAASICPPARTTPRRVVAKGMGDDVAKGLVGLAKLVLDVDGADKSLYGALSYKIGQVIYADFDGWHLYLRDMKGTRSDLSMAQVLGNTLGPKLMSGGKFDERDLEDLLRGVQVQLGGGKLKISLYTAMPSVCTQRLARICEDYAQDM